MTLGDFLGAVVQISIAVAFCGALIGAVIVAIRFAWVAAPHYASYRFPSPPSSATERVEGGPPMPPDLTWDIINVAERFADGKLMRSALAEKCGHSPSGTWYRKLKVFLDYHNL